MSQDGPTGAPGQVPRDARWEFPPGALSQQSSAPSPRPGPQRKDRTLPLDQNRFGNEDTLICQKWPMPAYFCFKAMLPFHLSDGTALGHLEEKLN